MAISRTGFFRSLFGGGSGPRKIKVHVTTDSSESVDLEHIALGLAVSFVSFCASSFRFDVVLKGVRAAKAERYILNTNPNTNQSGPDFWAEIAYNLLTYGEALAVDVGGHLYIADAWTVEENPFGVNAYHSISRHGVSLDIAKPESEVLHFVLPGGPDSMPIMSSLFDDYGRLAGMASDRYIPDQRYTLKISSIAQGDPDFEQNYKTMVEDSIVPFLTAKKGVLPLFDGFDLAALDGQTGARTTSEATDFQNLVTEAIKKAAALYHIPPGLLLGEAVTNDGLLDDFLSFCIQPIANIIQTELTRKRLSPSDVMAGGRIICDISQVIHFDVLRKSAQVEKLIGSGYYTIDKMRERAGELSTGDPIAQKRMVTKNFETAPEGGEKSG